MHNQWIEQAARAASVAPSENRSRIVRLFITIGGDTECAYCRKSVNAQTTLYEVDAIVAAGTRRMSFHRLCFHLWESHER
jgi:hypothetical protein